MKHSIYKIFKNLNLLVLISFITSLILFAFVAEQYYSYKRVDNLQNQKIILTKIALSQEKIKIIDFNSKIAILKHSIQKIKNQSQLNYISLYITKNEQKFITYLNTIETDINTFELTSKKTF